MFLDNGKDAENLKKSSCVFIHEVKFSLCSPAVELYVHVLHCMCLAVRFQNYMYTNQLCQCKIYFTNSKTTSD